MKRPDKNHLTKNKRFAFGSLKLPLATSLILGTLDEIEGVYIMSYKALKSLKNYVEIEFLKSCSYEKINEIINHLNDKIKKLEAENQQLQNTPHNSGDYQQPRKSCMNCLYSDRCVNLGTVCKDYKNAFNIA